MSTHLPAPLLPRPLASCLLLASALVAPCAAGAAKPRAEASWRGAREEPAGEGEEGTEARAGLRATESARIRRACAEQARSDQLLAGALRQLPGGRASFEGLRLTGLTAPSEEQVWKLLGGRLEGPVDADTAAAVLAQLQASGLFAEVALEGDAAAPGALVLRLAEHPAVRRVEVAGLRETDRLDLLGRLFDAPSVWESEPAREAPRPRRSSSSRRRSDSAVESVRCPSPLPERTWLARIEGGELRPGLVWKGLPAALERAVRWLRDEGYPLASARAVLSADGALALEVDEGRVQSLEVRGLPERMKREVEAALAFAPDAVFSSGELRLRLSALRERYPFLDLDRRRRVGLRAVETTQERAADGSLRATAAAAQGRGAPPAEESPGRRRLRALRNRFDWLDDLDLDFEDLEFDWDWDWDRDAFWLGRRNGQGKRRWLGVHSRQPYEVVGPGRLIIWLRTRQADLDVQWLQLFRHTPATGFAPGLSATLRLWDPGDRVHLALDGGFAVNTRRDSRDAGPTSDFLERLSAQEKVDWLVGARASIPALRVAELGGQVYTLTDTVDGWRLSDLNSYLYSALIGRPGREYFRRAGATALLTVHLFDQLTLGAELRKDRFDLLPNPHVWSLFNGDDPSQPSGPATLGRVGAAVFRLEWTSDEVPLYEVGAARRQIGVPLASRGAAPGPAFSTLNTLEVGNHALGSEAGIDYLHAVSDNRLRLDFGGRRMLQVRLRAGAGRDLPLQFQEALGGWGSLRGYDFKEFRGDASLLGSFELRSRHFGGFLDVGAVHQPAGGSQAAAWLDPRMGAGAQLFLDDHARFEAAWRLDGRASAVPEMRLLLGWEL